MAPILIFSAQDLPGVKDKVLCSLTRHVFLLQGRIGRQEA